MTARAPRVVGSAWDGATVPFITTPFTRSGFGTGQVVNDSNASENIFQLSSFIANTGTEPSVAIGGFAVGRKVWGENLLAGAMGDSAVAVGTEIDVGCYPCHFTGTLNGTTTVTNISVDRYGSKFTIGDTIKSGVGANIPDGTTITAVAGPATAPTSLTMSAAALVSGDNISISTTSSNQTAYGVLVVGEGGNIGGPGNASGVAIQVQGQTDSGFGTGLRFSSTGIAPTGSGVLLAGVSSTGKGIFFSTCDFSSAIELTGASTYTRILYANSITTQHVFDFGASTITGTAVKFGSATVGTGIDFGSATFSTAAMVFGAGHNVKLDTATGTKIGTGATQKLGFFNATPVAQQASTGTAAGFTAGAGTAVKDDSTFTGGSGSTAYRVSDVVLALKNLGFLAA